MILNSVVSMSGGRVTALTRGTKRTKGGGGGGGGGRRGGRRGSRGGGGERDGEF